MYALPTSYRNVTTCHAIAVGDIVHLPVFGSYVTITADNVMDIRSTVADLLHGGTQVAHRPAVSMVKTMVSVGLDAWERAERDAPGAW